MGKSKSTKEKLVKKAPAVAAKKTNSIDYTFLFLIMLILSIGLVMLLSSSAPAGATKFDNSYYFFTRQMVFVAVGIVGMVIVSKIDYRIYRKYGGTFFLICTIMLILVAIPGIGVERNGSRRWFQLPGFQIQPSEFMKLAISVLFARMIADNRYNLKSLQGSVPFIVILVLIVILMILEPHLSGLIIMVGIALCIMVSAGTPIVPLAAGGGIFGGLITLFIYLSDSNRWSRLIVFTDPFRDTRDAGFQIVQALYAMGSGGLFGRGIGQSVQKYSYLPEPYNDFIFSIACEELGLFGAAIIIGLFAFLIIRGFRIAVNAPDEFGSLLAIGIVSQVAIQTTLNIAVTTSSVPNTGVSLPFFSYGGTAILVLLVEMGILLNISRSSVNNRM